MMADEADIKTELKLFGVAYVYQDEAGDEYFLAPECVKVYTPEHPEGKSVVSRDEAKSIRHRLATDDDFAAEMMSE